MKIYKTNYPTAIGLYKPEYGREYSQKGVLEDYNDDNQCVSKDKNVNRGYCSGSFTGKEKAAANIWSKMFDNLIDACNNHTTIVQNLVALVLALGPRTVAILSLPGKKNKEDKVYAAGHAWASGLIGFGFASLVMYPLGVAAKKIKEDASKIQNRIEKSNEVKLVTKRLKKLATLENVNPDDLKPEKILEGISNIDEKFLQQFYNKNEAGEVTGLVKNVDYDKIYKDYNVTNLTKDKLLEGTNFIKKRFTNRFLANFVELDKNGNFIKINKNLDFDLLYKGINMAPDSFVFGVVKAMLTVALIPPILKYVFGLEKGNGKPTPTQKIDVTAKLDKQNPILNPKKIEGGAK